MEKVSKDNIENIIALTPLQEGMLFHYLKEPGSELYFEQLCLELEGNIRLHHFEKAWQAVIDSNDMLRTFFRWEKINQPTQVVLKKHSIKPHIFDFSTLTGESGNETDIKEPLDRILREDRQNTFRLEDVPFRLTLCKISSSQWFLILSYHHILFDGWSTGIILNEFFSVYDDLKHGDLLKPLSLKPSFKEYIKWCRNQDMEGQKNFWANYLSGYEPAGELPIKRKKPGIPFSSENLFKHRILFDLETTGKIEDFLKHERITWASFFYSAWGILLQKYTNTGDVVLGTTTSGRSAPIKGIEQMVGLFIILSPCGSTKILPPALAI